MSSSEELEYALRLGGVSSTSSLAVWDTFFLSFLDLPVPGLSAGASGRSSKWIHMWRDSRSHSRSFVVIAFSGCDRWKSEMVLEA